jgi:hypothetical protein
MSPRWGCTIEFHDGRADVHYSDMTEEDAKRQFESLRPMVHPTASVALWRREEGKKIVVDYAALPCNRFRMFK